MSRKSNCEKCVGVGLSMVLEMIDDRSNLLGTRFCDCRTGHRLKKESEATHEIRYIPVYVKKPIKEAVE